jgi:hypothetical protein
VSTTAVVLVALLAVSSCSRERSPSPIFDAKVSDGGTTLDVGVGFCGNVSVEVEETDLRVELTAFGGSDRGGDCAGGATVTLDRPLGDRMLIDTSTGDEIPVTVIGG